MTKEIEGNTADAPPRDRLYDLETEFVRQVAALTPGLAVGVLAAELEHIPKIRMVPANMPDVYRHWAEAWTPTQRLPS